MMTIDPVLHDATVAAVSREMARAELKYGQYRSTHEGLGVLAEEYAELIEAIRSNDCSAIGKEAIQVASVAARIASCLDDADTRRRSGIEP